MDLSKVKLGCNHPPHDPDNLWLHDYVDVSRTALLQPKPSEDWTPAVTVPWGMLGNGPDPAVTFPNFQGAGNCVVAGFGHVQMGWNFNAGRPIVPTSMQAISEYATMTGYDPTRTAPDGSNPTDTGMDPLTLLKRARKLGVFGRKIGSFVQIVPQKQIEIMTTIDLFGSAFMAFDLPDVFRDLTDWIMPSGQKPVGKWSPNPNNGHMVEFPAYDADGVDVITWGDKIRANWNWIAHYSSFGYCVFSLDLLSDQWVSPEGFNKKALLSDLAEVTGE